MTEDHHKLAIDAIFSKVRAKSLGKRAENDNFKKIQNGGKIFNMSVPTISKLPWFD